MNAPLSVLVQTPLKKDAALLEAVLRENRHAPVWLTSPEDLERRLLEHKDVLVCTQEGLTYDVRERLLRVLGQQPPWAHLPLVLIIDHHIAAERVEAELAPIFKGGHLTLLHRPLRPLEFATAIEAAVSSRLKQLEIRDGIEYQRELQRELNHRVKNMMATFMAIYRMTLQQSESLSDFSQRFQGRVRALSAVHDLLQETRDNQRSIGAICRDILAPYHEENDSRFEIDGPDVPLTRTPAMLLGLILNELVTNAVKHGSLSSSTGLVSVRWDIEGEGSRTLNLVWRERGGPPVRAPTESGYGSRFIAVSAKGLGGAWSREFHPEGLECKLTVPASALLSEH